MYHLLFLIQQVKICHDVTWVLYARLLILSKIVRDESRAMIPISVDYHLMAEYLLQLVVMVWNLSY